jgi:hypothetical protein
MRRLLTLLIAVLTVSLTAALYARAGAASSPTRFRSPEAGAACRVEGTALICSSLGSPGSVLLRSHGGATIVDRLPWWDASTPVLRSFHRGALSCRLIGSAIVCRNGTTAIRIAGDGFSVAR